MNLHLPKGISSLFEPRTIRDLLALRHGLHRRPELAFGEVETSAALEKALDALKPMALERVAETGLIARIGGRDPAAPVVAIRGDMDALPITEETDLPYASERPGVMHACGHDVHAAWAIGAATLLSHAPAAGDVLIVLQPAEETGSGAKAILKSGLLDKVAAIFGGHVDPKYALGEVVAQAGPLAASTDTFRITLQGAGSHGARPQEGHDPIVGASALVGALQTVVSRRLDPAAPAVVTVAMFNAGSAANIIPDQAILEGTLRAVEPDVRDSLRGHVEQIANDVAAAYGLTAEMTIIEGTPPIVNEARAAGWANQAVVDLLGAAAAVSLGSANMGGEDFSFYLERMQGCFLRIGAREPGAPAIPAHSAKFTVPDEALFIGAAILAETARNAAGSLAAEVGR